MESKDSGLWINSFDYTGIQHITPHVPEINDSFRTHCREDRPFCGYPWFLPVKFLSKSVALLCFHSLSPARTASSLGSFRKNWYLPAPEVSPSSPVEFNLLSKEETSWGTIKMTFRVTGWVTLLLPSVDKDHISLLPFHLNAEEESWLQINVS